MTAPDRGATYQIALASTGSSTHDIWYPAVAAGLHPPWPFAAGLVPKLTVPLWARTELDLRRSNLKSMCRDELFAHARYEHCGAAAGPSMIAPSMSPLLSLPVGFALVYAILLSCYFGTCVTVTWLSRRRPDHKIQKDRQAPPGQIKRDIRESVSSLAVISFLFTLGAWFHYQSGWGYQIHQMTIANTIVSFGFSMLVFDTWFYWFHRLLHTRWFFKHTHRWHHLIRTPVAWSNDSDTLADNCFLGVRLFHVPDQPDCPADSQNLRLGHGLHRPFGI